MTSAFNKLIEKINVKDENLNRVQDKVLNAVNPALAHPLLQAVVLDSETSTSGTVTPLVHLTTSFQNIPHKLARAYLGWLPVSQNANVTVWEDPLPTGSQANPDPTKFVRLKASGSVALKLLVF